MKENCINLHFPFILQAVNTGASLLFHWKPERVFVLVSALIWSFHDRKYKTRTLRREVLERSTNLSWDCDEVVSSHAGVHFHLSQALAMWRSQQLTQLWGNRTQAQRSVQPAHVGRA